MRLLDIKNGTLLAATFSNGAFVISYVPDDGSKFDLRRESDKQESTQNS